VMTQRLPTTVLLGNTRQASRTHAVARHAVARLRYALGLEGFAPAEPDVVDLAQLGPTLIAENGYRCAEVDRALEIVCRRGLLVVVSPTFKGSYTGLLKVFADLLPIEGLAGVVAVAVMTAGWPEHRLAVDLYLRTLLVELGATVPVRGLCVLEGDFADPDVAVGPWVRRATPALAAVLRQTIASPAADRRELSPAPSGLAHAPSP